MSRIDAIRGLLAKTPADTFLLYSLGMELLSAGQFPEAAKQFQRVIELDADYLAAYPQAAQALEKAGRQGPAAEMLRRGLTVAAAAGDTHAADRMKLLLQALGD